MSDIIAKKKKVAVFTGNRAEYGLQFPILKAIEKHPSLTYQLIVSGAHLEDDYGRSLSEIKNDGFHIHKEIKIDAGLDLRTSTAQAIGSAVLAISQALEELRPDIVIVYADRFEGFAAVIASSQMGIPTAHVEGGDITEGGALDDAVRHAMTKLSHLHFTTNWQSYNCVLSLGEERWRVHNVGLPSNDLIAAGDYCSIDDVKSLLHIDDKQPIVVFTQHSISTDFENAAEQLKPSLLAIEKLAGEGVQCILTYPNNDVGGSEIVEALTKIKEKNISNVKIFSSLGRKVYHGLLAFALDADVKIACVGNSSSGIKETPFFLCPTVNIGSRQKGRLRGCNVIEAAYDTVEIYNAVKRCFYDFDFRQKCRKTKNPYYFSGAGNRIAKVIAQTELGKSFIRKKMASDGLDQS